MCQVRQLSFLNFCRYLSWVLKMLQGALVATPFCPRSNHFVLTGGPTQLKGKTKYRPYFQRQLSCQHIKGVYCGEPEWLCLFVFGRKWCKCSIALTHEQAQSRNWQEATFGGHRWIQKLKRMWKIVSDVKDCVRVKAPLHPWEWPETAWSRIHAHYAGPIDGMSVVVMVDAYH